MSMRCWGFLGSFDFAMEHLFVQILCERARLAVMMVEEKLGGVRIFCSLWQADAAIVHSGVILLRRKEVHPMDD